MYLLHQTQPEGFKDEGVSTTMKQIKNVTVDLLKDHYQIKSWEVG